MIENACTADGRKLSRATNGVLTYYVYDGNVVIEEQDEDNDETSRNIYGRNLITRETSDGIVVYAYNGHSDVVAICNIDGDALVVYEYDEFGNLIDEVVTDETYTNFDNPYRYAGYEYIGEVKLYDLNARYYNPEIARFLSPDPYYNLGNRVIGLYEINVPNAWSIIQANNIYVYCMNNSIMFYDPTGLVVTAWDEAHCTAAEVARLRELTKIWEFANTMGDNGVKQAAHNEAEQIRNQYRKDGEHGFDDGSTGINNSKYHLEYGTGKTVVTSGGSIKKAPVVDVDVNIGAGFGGKVNVNGLQVEAVVSASADVIDDSVSIINGGVRARNAKAEISAGLNDNVSITAGYTYTYDYNTSNVISKGGHFGIGVKNVTAEYNDDIELSFGGEAYFFVGGGVSVSFNFSELRRRIQGFME